METHLREVSVGEGGGEEMRERRRDLSLKDWVMEGNHENLCPFKEETDFGAKTFFFFLRVRQSEVSDW